MSTDPVTREYEQLAAHADPDGPLAPYLAWVRERLLPIFQEHDQAAVHHATRHKRATRFIYVASATVVALVAVQTLFLPSLPQIIWGEVLIIGVMLWVQHRSKRRGNHPRWLEHRYVAERLRTGIFTFPLRDAAGDSAGHQSLLDPGERCAAWHAALERLALEDRPLIDVPAALPALRRFIAEGWCANQRGYHENVTLRSHKSLAQIELWGMVFLLVTIAAAVLHALGVGHHSAAGHIFTLLALVLPAVAAAMNAIKHSLELHKLGLRSERMSEGLQRFGAAIAATKDTPTLTNQVLELERFFLWEHEEWFSLLSFKKADVG